MRTCRICKTKFMPRYPMQPVCDAFECRCAAARQAKAEREKAQKGAA